ncbi:hypothetical protein, partial [Streptomyces roseolus]|uniref:hypothetical protein n=1 Tax=Streptomyces roseolus TaxID=67358 RepID=UPI0036676D70
LKPRAQQLADALPQLEDMGNRLEPVIGSAHALTEKLRELVIPEGGIVVDQSGLTVPAPAGLCVPLPGKEC